MATQAHIISRRVALAAFAVLPSVALASSLVPSSLVPSSLVGEIEHVNMLVLSDGGQHIDVHYPRYADVLRKIEELPSDSLENLRTKARALKTIYGSDTLLDDAGESTDVRLARQIINGLLALPVVA
jgi:hypothetical protein